MNVFYLLLHLDFSSERPRMKNSNEPRIRMLCASLLIAYCIITVVGGGLGRQRWGICCGHRWTHILNPLPPLPPPRSKILGLTNTPLKRPKEFFKNPWDSYLLYKHFLLKTYISNNFFAPLFGILEAPLWLLQGDSLTYSVYCTPPPSLPVRVTTWLVPVPTLPVMEGKNGPNIFHI